MIKLIGFGTVLLTSILIRCDQKYVRFETAQPEGVKASKTFHKKLRGEFVNCQDPNKILVISKNQIVIEHHDALTIHRNDLEIDSPIDKTNDELLREELSTYGYLAEFYSDSIKLIEHWKDTIFQFASNEILKKFQGSYFLNYELEEGFWAVDRLDLRKDSLFIGAITPSDELLTFNFTVKNEEFNEKDSTTSTEYLLKPSRDQFKKFMKSNAFEQTECYYRKKMICHKI